MRLFRPLFFVFSALAMMAVSSLAMPIADLRHLTTPAVAEQAMLSSVDTAHHLTASVVSEVMRIAFVALLLAIVVLSIAAGVMRRRRQAAEFDGGYFDAWRLPDQPPG